ncbi:hypothetical protein JRO89_XS03G0229300 [Xanthoceras sorbifolium]|uniref:Myb-like domain-containing protein n=1 Tax=Xanthoceras sorbifolium TaxID=99658 RepID=A0ABQ8IBB3_9ROSI|nr:hypothetical protein JRO89_XS03G0229300 [Xanthoceras sorbifolium]
MKMEGGSGSGSRCMRSQVGPDWTVKESLILVNEIAAVDADCLKALSTYQKWKIISENCTALDVPRSSNQCRRKWDSLLAHYTTIVNSKKNQNFPSNFDQDLFKAIDDLVRAKGNQSDTDPDSDPEAKSDLCEVIAQLGSKRQRRHCTPAESCSEEKALKEKHQKICTEEKQCKNYVEEWPRKGQADKKSQKSHLEQNNTSSIKEKEQMMVAKLRENAELVHAIATENADYSAANSRNVQDYKSEFARRQGDKLIECLGEIVKSLNQLSDHVL